MATLPIILISLFLLLVGPVYYTIAGAKVAEALFLTIIIEKVGVGLFTSLCGFVSGALMVLWSFILVKFIKKPEIKKSHKVKKEKNKQIKTQAQVSQPIKTKYPEPQVKPEDKNHKIKF